MIGNTLQTKGSIRVLRKRINMPMQLLLYQLPLRHRHAQLQKQSAYYPHRQLLVADYGEVCDGSSSILRWAAYTRVHWS